MIENTPRYPKIAKINGSCPHLKKYLKARTRLVNRGLNRFLDRKSCGPEPIRRAMRYSVMAGGKRLRPILLMTAAECCGKRAETVLPSACAVEMIHTYSLIHDDLPAIDNDDLRRGKPTSHKVFGEALAILAGDSLLTYAFELVSSNADVPEVGAGRASRAARILARAAGSRGMVGGQVVDILSEKRSAKSDGHSLRRQLKLLEYIHTHKTAALISACLEAGAVLAGAGNSKRKALARYGRHLGLAFQIVDDILDVTGDKSKLGKRGSDRENQKLTYPAALGIGKSREIAERTISKAHASLKPLGARAGILHALADYVFERDR